VTHKTATTPTAQMKPAQLFLFEHEKGSSDNITLHLTALRSFVLLLHEDEVMFTVSGFADGRPGLQRRRFVLFYRSSNPPQANVLGQTKPSVFG